MSKKTQKKRQTIDINEIRNKKAILENELEKLKNQKQKSEIRMILDEISDVILKYREENLSYSKIAKAIYNTYSIRISASTIRAYVNNVLIPKKKRPNIKIDDIQKIEMDYTELKKIEEDISKEFAISMKKRYSKDELKYIDLYELYDNDIYHL